MMVGGERRGGRRRRPGAARRGGAAWRGRGRGERKKDPEGAPEAGAPVTSAPGQIRRREKEWDGLFPRKGNLATGRSDPAKARSGVLRPFWGLWPGTCYIQCQWNSTPPKLPFLFPVARTSISWLDRGLLGACAERAPPQHKVD